VRKAVFGKIFRQPKRDGTEPFSCDTAAYERALAELGPATQLWFCLSDDHFDDARYGDFYRSLIARRPGWIVSSPLLRERLEALGAASVRVYPEPVEMARREARVPRRGLRERIGASLARRFKIGLE